MQISLPMFYIPVMSSLRHMLGTLYPSAPAILSGASCLVPSNTNLLYLPLPLPLPPVAGSLIALVYTFLLVYFRFSFS